MKDSSFQKSTLLWRLLFLISETWTANDISGKLVVGKMHRVFRSPASSNLMVIPETNESNVQASPRSDHVRQVGGLP